MTPREGRGWTWFRVARGTSPAALPSSFLATHPPLNPFLTSHPECVLGFDSSVWISGRGGGGGGGDDDRLSTGGTEGGFCCFRTVASTATAAVTTAPSAAVLHTSEIRKVSRKGSGGGCCPQRGGGMGRGEGNRELRGSVLFCDPQALFFLSDKDTMK